jgi:hypothetical protein
LIRGDECFGWLPDVFDERTVFRSLGINEIDRVGGYQRIIVERFMELLTERITEKLDSLSRKVSLKNVHNRKDFFYLDQRLKYLLNPLSYIKGIEIEIRNPYLDNEILEFLVKVPVKYRVGKNLYVKTIKKMFPEIFTETAQQSNLIEWDVQMRKSMELRSYLSDELMGKPSLIYEFIDQENFRKFLVNGGTMENRLRLLGYENRWFRRHPRVYKFLRQIYRKLQRTGRMERIELPRGTIVRRVLTLKLWCDLFLEGEAKSIPS